MLSFSVIPTGNKYGVPDNGLVDGPNPSVLASGKTIGPLFIVVVIKGGVAFGLLVLSLWHAISANNKI